MNCDLKMDSPGVDRDTREPTAPAQEDSESLELTNQSEENRDKEESGAGEGGVSTKLEDGDVVVRGASSEDKEEVEESPEETVSLGGEGEAVNSQDSEEHVDEKEERICTPERESSVHQDLPSSQEHSAGEGKVTPTADTAMSAASGGSETPEEGEVPSEHMATPTSDSAVASFSGRGVAQGEEEVACELKATPTSDTDGVSVSGGGVAQGEGEVPPEEMATPTTEMAVALVRGKGGATDEGEVPSEHMATPTTDTAVASVSGKGGAPEKGDTAGQQGARRVAEEEKHAGKRGEGPRKKKSAPITPKSSSSPSSVSLPRSRTAPRSSAGGTKKDILAKFQQSCPEGPVIPNFKVQRSRRAGVSDGSSVKQRLLQWCRKRTAGYPGVSIENYSSSWSDGLAFCALVHHFFPHAFDFSSLRAEDRERNFSLAFTTAE
nr:PREDICTED: smoothelin-like protein 2 isoform X2 [Lepisosteus oculatus]